MTQGPGLPRTVQRMMGPGANGRAGAAIRRPWTNQSRAAGLSWSSARRLSTLHLSPVSTMSPLLVLVLGLAAPLVTGHELHTGQCPSFTPMQAFDWEKVTWSYVTLTLTHCMYPDTVLLRRVVRHREVRHPVPVPHIRVQDGHPWVQVHRAGSVTSRVTQRCVTCYSLHDNGFVFRRMRFPTQTSSGLTIITCRFFLYTFPLEIRYCLQHVLL